MPEDENELETGATPGEEAWQKPKQPERVPTQGFTPEDTARAASLTDTFLNHQAPETQPTPPPSTEGDGHFVPPVEAGNPGPVTEIPPAMPPMMSDAKQPEQEEMTEQEKNKINFERAFDIYTRVIQNIHQNIGSTENQYRVIDVPTIEIANYVLQMFGKNPEDLIGKSISGEEPYVHVGTRIATIAGRGVTLSSGQTSRYGITY